MLDFVHYMLYNKYIRYTKEGSTQHESIQYKIYTSQKNKYLD